MDQGSIPCISTIAVVVGLWPTSAVLCFLGATPRPPVRAFARKPERRPRSAMASTAYQF